PFDISKLPEAALETHFLSLKPSALPPNLGTIVIDDNHHEEAAPDSNDEQDDNEDDDATADVQHSPSPGSDEEDDEDQTSEGAPEGVSVSEAGPSEGAPPRHVSPPHTPRDSDDEFDDLMTPPQPTADEISVNILSHHIGEEDPNLIPGQVPRPPRLILRPPAAVDPSEVSFFSSFIL
ncbi:hypothetical protein PQX77_003633, partial [Marasmius sp. AFHP31]